MHGMLTYSQSYFYQTYNQSIQSADTINWLNQIIQPGNRFQTPKRVKKEPDTKSKASDWHNIRGEA